MILNYKNLKNEYISLFENIDFPLPANQVISEFGKQFFKNFNAGSFSKASPNKSRPT